MHANGLHIKFDRHLMQNSRIHGWMLGDIGLMRAELTAVELSPVHESVPSWQGELVYLKVVVSGSIVIEYGGQFQRFEEGSVIALDPARRFNELVPVSTSLIVLRVPKARLQKRGWSPRLGGVIALDVGAPDTKAVRDLFGSIADQTDAASASMQTLLGNQLFDLAEVVLAAPGDGVQRRSADAIVFRAKDFIRRHLGSDEVDAAMVASAVNVSAKHLQRLFADQGLSLMRYVWQCRLEHAETLLRSQSMQSISVQEIGWQCGFTTAAHFSRAFRQRYGRSPGSMKERMAVVTGKLCAGSDQAL